MSRFDWLKNFEQHLKTGTKEEIQKYINYCEVRSKLQKQTKRLNEWDKRKIEGERILSERFELKNE